MELDLENKTALITGSSKGIGKAIANELNKEGCNVILNGKNKSELKEAIKSLENKSDYFVADVTNQKFCKKLINYISRKYRGLDILICNVGNGTSVPPGKETNDEWQKMISINLFSATNIIQESRKLLSKNNGTIVCVSSIASIETAGAPITYSSAKAALNTYVKQSSRPLAKQGIRINAVVPGNIMFEGSVWEGKMKENPKKVKKMIKNEVPLGRFGHAKEVGDLVTFLVSPKAAFITGSIFVIDGGQTRSF